MRRIGYARITQKGEDKAGSWGDNTAKESEEKMGKAGKHERQAEADQREEDTVNEPERQSHSILDFVSFH